MIIITYKHLVLLALICIGALVFVGFQTQGGITYDHNQYAQYVSSGDIVMRMSTPCTQGWSELPQMADKFPMGALVLSGKAGQSGGNSTITPAGTINAQTFTGTANQATSLTSGGTPAGTISTPTFTGTALATHTHELPFQVVSNVLVRQIASTIFGTGTARSGIGDLKATASSTPAAPVALSQAISAGTPAGIISTPTFTGSALATHGHTLTPAGTVQQAIFTGTSVSIIPPYVSVIFCVKD